MKILCIRQGFKIVPKPFSLEETLWTIDGRHLWLLSNRAEHGSSVPPPAGCFLSIFQFLIFIEDEN